MLPPLDLRVPRSRRLAWLAMLISIALHGLLLLYTVEGRVHLIPAQATRLIVLTAPVPDGSREAEAPFYSSARERGKRKSPGGPRERRVRAEPAPAVRVVEPAQPVARDTGAVAAGRPFVRIGPGLGGAQLWVRPLPLPPQELAQRLNRSHEALLDSAVTATVQAFLDSIASEPGAEAAELPSWTTKIAGKTFGLDSRNIYIAGLKIPAAVLALLPLPQDNVDQARAYNHLQEMRADLHRAAARAATADEFKQAIRDIRARKERERELKKAQQEAPPPENPPTP